MRVATKCVALLPTACVLAVVVLVTSAAPADKRFPAGTPPEVVQTILKIEAEAGRYEACRGRIRLAQRDETPWLKDALAQLEHDHALVRLAALDLLLASVRDGLLGADVVRAKLLPTLQVVKVRMTGEGERHRMSRLAFAARVRVRSEDESLAELEKALFGAGTENWPLALESVFLLGEGSDEKAAALLARRLETEQNQGSDFAHRLREARAKVDLRHKTSAMNNEWDRALLLYGAVVGAQHSVPSSHLACELLGLLEQQGSDAARAFLKQMVDDPNQNATLRQQAADALARLKN